MVAVSYIFVSVWRSCQLSVQFENNFLNLFDAPLTDFIVESTVDAYLQ